MIQTLFIGYGLIVLAVALLQRRLLFFPDTFPESLAEQRGAESGFLPWKNGKGEIIGWKLPANGPATRSVLIVHGNAGSASGRDYIAQPIHDTGSADVFVLEYPGYGARGGSPGKDSFLAAGEAAFALLPADRPRYLVSESLGTGVAAHLAGSFPDQVAGLVCFVPYHSLPWVAQRKMPFVPAYALLVDRFQPAESLKSYNGPVKVVIAERDEVIPPEAGRRLFAAYRGRKELEEIAGARHNEVAGQTPQWWNGTFEFLHAR
jgi:uncharacterized protein